MDETAHPASPFVAPPKTPAIPAPWTEASSVIDATGCSTIAVSG